MAVLYLSIPHQQCWKTMPARWATTVVCCECIQTPCCPAPGSSLDWFEETTHGMKAVVSSGQAYFCTVLSTFAIVILSVLGYLFKTNHESMMGSVNDPEDGAAVAGTIFGAVFVYLAFFLFCGCQVLVIQRQDRIKL